MREATTVVPKPLLKIIERALEPEAAARWPVLDDMLRALEATIAPNRAPLAIAAGVFAAAAIGIATYALTRPPPVDAALPRKIAIEIAPLYDLVAHDAEDGAVAVQAYKSALAATGDPRYRLKLGMALVSAESCSANAELDRYVADTHTRLVEVLGAEDYNRQLGLRTRCASDPSSTMDDLEEIEHLADELDRSEPDKAIIVLDHAIRVAHGKEPVLYLRLGDFQSSYGECAAAREAYEQYLAVTHLAPDEIAEVHQREQACVPAHE
jgi:tetratricopeptide (TPR) repeat protein